MYVTGQGIWSSEDANLADTDKPTHFTFLNHGLEETAVTGLVSPPAGAPLLSVMGDICGFRHDDLNVAPAKGMFGNPIFSGGTDIDVAWSKPEIVARVGSKGDAGKRGAYSIDGGITWTPFASEPSPALARAPSRCRPMVQRSSGHRRTDRPLCHAIAAPPGARPPDCPGPPRSRTGRPYNIPPRRRPRECQEALCLRLHQGSRVLQR